MVGCNCPSIKGLFADTQLREREIIRKQVPAVVFHVFNWTFISFIQSILLFLLAAPAYILLLASKFEPSLTSADFAYVSIEISLVVIEWFADQQQWGMMFLTTPTRATPS